MKIASHSCAVERCRDPPVELVDRSLLVQHRDDDRDVHQANDDAPGRQVESHGEAAQERIADEAVVADALEHDGGIVLHDRGCAVGMDGAAQGREPPGVCVTGLVRPVDDAHRRIVERHPDARSEAVVEDQHVAAHVDLDPSDPASRQDERA